MVFLVLVILLGEFLLGMKIAYPITEEQLFLAKLGFGNLWLVRIFSLSLLVIGIYFFYKTLRNKLKELEIAFCILFVAVSPTFFSSWYSYPQNCIKIFFVFLLIWLLTRFKINKKFIFLLMSIFLILFNFFSYKEKAEFFSKLDLVDAKKEVMERVSSEDSLTYQVKFPLVFRRIAYNKYFLVFKMYIKELVNYFDIENNFFQEIHPTEQKSLVIFYWPAIYLFFVGSWVFVRKRKQNDGGNIIILLFGLSMVNFYFSKGPVFQRNLLNLLPIGILIGIGASHLIDYILKKNYFLFKFVAIVILVFNIYGFLNGFYDIQKRPSHWFDNRPVAFEFIFNNLNKEKVENYRYIYLTTLFGETKKYCNYYVGNCDNKKIVFDSFNFENKVAENNSLYIGFAGEFLGKDFYNFPSEWKKMIVDKGFVVIDSKKIEDNIANGFGDYLVVARK